MNDKEVVFVADFTRRPRGRLKVDFPGTSGEEFRDERLIPKLTAGRRLIVDFRGTETPAPSFLQEAFARLMKHGFDYKFVKDHLDIRCDSDPSVVSEANHYIDEAGLQAGR